MSLPPDDGSSGPTTEPLPNLIAPESTSDSACSLVRYPPNLFMEQFGPYETAYKIIQGILFYRRPIAFWTILAFIELSFFSVAFFRLGFLSIISIAFTFYWIGLILFDKYGEDFIAICFPPIDEGAAPIPNRIYPLLPFCQGISHIFSTIVDAFENMHASAKLRPITGIAVGLAGQILVFLVLMGTGTFWPLFVIVHLFYLVPGIVLHPSAFRYTEPYILKVGKAIRSPSCQANK
jgi:hypothetical protein